MAGLESAAPPVELDRPQKLQIEETALPIAALPETAQPTTDLPQTAPLETALPALVVPGSAPFVPALSSPEGVKNADSTDPQVSVTQLSSSRQSYAPAAAAVANAADQSSPGSGAPMSQPVASFSINAVSDTARPAEELDSSAATTNQESRKTEVAESRQAAAAATSGDNATHGSSQAAGGVSLGSQVVSPDLEPVSYTPVLVDKEGDEQTATLDQDLDAVIEELSLELRSACKPLLHCDVSGTRAVAFYVYIAHVYNNGTHCVLKVLPIIAGTNGSTLLQPGRCFLPHMSLCSHSSD